MTTQTEELGTRVVRALVMENSGPHRRRVWWIVRTSIVADLGSARLTA